jgi:hypothetical protein
MLSDPHLAREVMLRVQHKGALNPARGGHLAINTLTLNTGDRWKARRNHLHQAFSAASLFNSDTESLISLKIQDICDVLSASADKSHTIELDNLFGRLSISINCSVLFHLEVRDIKTFYEIGELYSNIKHYTLVWLYYILSHM